MNSKRFAMAAALGVLWLALILLGLLVWQPAAAQTDELSTEVSTGEHADVSNPGSLAYVTLNYDDLVALVDTTTHAITGTVDVGTAGCDFPWRAAMSPDGNFVYVSCFGSGSVAVIETISNTVVTNVSGIPSADGIAFTRDGNYALVGSRSYGQIAIIDTATYFFSFIYTPNNPRSIAAHPALDRAYATCQDGTILVIDTTTFGIVNSINVGGDPWDVSVSPDGQWVFAGDRWGSGLDVIDASSDTVYTTVTGLGNLTGLDVAPDGSRVYASNLSGNIQVIDTSSFTAVTSVGVSGSPWEAAINCDGSELYVGNNSSQVPVVDTASLAVTYQIPMPGQYSRGIAICPQQVASGLHLSPGSQANSGARGEMVIHHERLLNLTGTTDSFNLTLGSYAWDAALSANSVGPIAAGDSVTFSVYVTVPIGVDWYSTDTVVLSATSVASPTVYSGTATLTTQAYAPPDAGVLPDVLTSIQYVNQVVTEALTISNGNAVTLTFSIGGLTGSGCNIVSGQSEQTQGDLDDTYAFFGQTLRRIYLYAYSSDSDTLYARVTAYDAGTGNWVTLYEGTGGSRLILDQEYDPLTYSQVRVELDDTEDNDTIYYDYSFEWCSPVTWLFAKPVSGTVGSDSSQVISVTFDATGLQPSIYSTDMLIQTDDPTAPTIRVPLTMTVEPTANMGWVEGTVTDQSTGDPLEATVIALGQALTITTNPATGVYTLWLDEGSHTLQVSADGYVTETAIVDIVAQQGTTQDFALVLNVPAIEVSPENLEVTQEMGNVTTEWMTITNAGPAYLTFELAERDTTPGLTMLEEYARTEKELADIKAQVASVDDPHNKGVPTVARFPTEAFVQLQGATRILAWTAYTDYYQEYQNTLNAIAQFTSYSLVETTNTDPAIVAALLAEADVFLLPEQELADYGSLYSIGTTWAGILEDFVASGGTVVAMDHCNRTVGLIQGAGLMDLLSIGCSSDLPVEVVEPDHPLAQGVNTTFVGANGTDYYSQTNGLEIVRYAGTPWPVVVAKDIGAGHVVMVGFDFYEYNTDMARLLANAVLWYGGDVPWLSEEPISGTVPGYSSIPIQVTFDASGLQPGDLTADIVIRSNDPVTTSMSIPVTMTVLPSGDMGRVVGTVSDAWTGLPLTATVELVGTYSTTASPDFGLWAPAGTYSLSAYTSGYYTSSVPVTIVAGETVAENVALEPALPRLEWTPDVVAATASEGSRVTQRLWINNTGPLPLEIAFHEISPTLVIQAPTPDNLTGKRILYDRAHGEPGTSGYSTLIADAVGAGAEVIENWYYPIEAPVLEGYDVLWINCCGGTAWGFGEMEVVSQWLAEGGAVFVQGESSAATTGPASIYGINYHSGSCASGTTTGILEHSISEGVDAVYVEGTCWWLASSGGADIVVYDPQGQPHVLAQDLGGGKMVVVAGEDFIDGHIDSDDNRLLANNILAWLARPTYNDVPWLTLKPQASTIPGHSTLPITLEFDATTLSPGIYQATLAIEHNDRSQIFPIELPVTLKVIEHWNVFLPLIVKNSE